MNLKSGMERYAVIRTYGTRNYQEGFYSRPYSKGDKNINIKINIYMNIYIYII